MLPWLFIIAAAVLVLHELAVLSRVDRIGLRSPSAIAIAPDGRTIVDGFCSQVAADLYVWAMSLYPTDGRKARRIAAVAWRVEQRRREAYALPPFDGPKLIGPPVRG